MARVDMWIFPALLALWRIAFAPYPGTLGADRPDHGTTSDRD